MAITAVGSQEEYLTSGFTNPETLVVDTGTRTNGLLVITYMVWASDVLSAWTTTYAGDSMTEGLSWNYDSDKWIKIFVLSNPSDGSDSFSSDYTIDGGGVMQLIYKVASWYDGGNQTAAEDQTSTGTGATDPSVAITPSEDNELIVSAYTSEANSVLAPTSPHTMLQEHDGGPRVFGGGYTIQTTAAEETVAWTGVDDTWYMGVASFKEEAAAGGRTTKNTDPYGLGIALGVSRTFKVHG